MYPTLKVLLSPVALTDKNAKTKQNKHKRNKRKKKTLQLFKSSENVIKLHFISSRYWVKSVQ